MAIAVPLRRFGLKCHSVGVLVVLLDFRPLVIGVERIAASLDLLNEFFVVQGIIYVTPVGPINSRQVQQIPRIITGKQSSRIQLDRSNGKIFLNFYPGEDPPGHEEGIAPRTEPVSLPGGQSRCDQRIERLVLFDQLPRYEAY